MIEVLDVNRTVWKKGMSLRWSRGLHFFLSLPARRLTQGPGIWNSAHNVSYTLAEMPAWLVMVRLTAPCPKVLHTGSCIFDSRCPGYFVWACGKFPNRNTYHNRWKCNEGNECRTISTQDVGGLHHHEQQVEGSEYSGCEVGQRTSC